mgnify:FL=1
MGTSMTVPISEVLRDRLRVESPTEWWDRILDTLCKVWSNGTAWYDAVKGTCEVMY